MRPVSWGAPISWEQADPFATSNFIFQSLKKVGKDSTVLLICITVFLSYLPEAGQYSSFFLYLRQTVFLRVLMRSIGNKNTVLLGLGFQMLQLAWYGFGSEPWMMWAAGAIAAMSSITFPAVSALVSRSAESDQQGVVQGMVTGIRGLCNGLGPALYGFIFFLFHVELNELAPVLQTAETTAMQVPIERVCDRTYAHISFMNLFTQVTFQKYLVLITKVWKSRDWVRSGPLFCGWTVCVDLHDLPCSSISDTFGLSIL
ncbi:UNVERIFIED_CONTAM: hypothetical protein FKN15_009758 [Acipenser sinensis]